MRQNATFRCTEDISVVDFGPVFTNSTCVRRITLENKGRRQQVCVPRPFVCACFDVQLARDLMISVHSGGHPSFLFGI